MKCHCHGGRRYTTVYHPALALGDLSLHCTVTVSQNPELVPGVFISPVDSRKTRQEQSVKFDKYYDFCYLKDTNQPDSITYQV